MKAPAAVQINLQYLSIITATVQQEQLESNQHNTDKRSTRDKNENSCFILSCCCFQSLCRTTLTRTATVAVYVFIQI